MSTRAVTIVGPGRIGLAIGGALAENDETLSLTYFGRHPEPPGHPLFTQGRARHVFGIEPLERDCVALILAVPDEALGELAYAMAAAGPAPEGCTAFHTSAQMPLEALAPLYERGYAVGSFHPLMTITNPVLAAGRLPGSFIALEGGPQATGTGRVLAETMGARALVIPSGRRPIFYAAATMTSGYLFPLLDRSARLMERAGIDPDEGAAALISMIRGTVTAIEDGDPRGAMSGVVAQGDIEAAELHLRALDPDDARRYALFGLEALESASEVLNSDAHKELMALFERQLELETTTTRS